MYLSNSELYYIKPKEKEKKNKTDNIATENWLKMLTRLQINSFNG